MADCDRHLGQKWPLACAKMSQVACQNGIGTPAKMSHPYNLISYVYLFIFIPPPIGAMETTSIDNNTGQDSLDAILDGVKKSERKPPRHKKGEKFLKGPIPLNWLLKAASISGGAFKVAIVIWFLVGVSNKRTISLPNGLLDKFGVSKRTKYRCLKAMERAGLISISQGKGSSPVIEVNSVE